MLSSCVLLGSRRNVAATKGVFFHHPSKTFSTKVGEPRFSVYSASRTFDQIDDLRLLSEDLWHIDSSPLSARLGLRNHLIQGQLLDVHCLSVSLETISGIKYSNAIPNHGQPLLRELFRGKPPFYFLFRHPQWSSKQVPSGNSFMTKQVPLVLWYHYGRKSIHLTSLLTSYHTGCAIVCLEQHPTVQYSSRKSGSWSFNSSRT